jgi:phosphatidylinositol alpha-1,6-mannosyltransferase
MADHVTFTGSVGWARLPEHYAAGDVFAMPCRAHAAVWTSRAWIVYLEASATAAVDQIWYAGRRPARRTGFVMSGRDVPAVARQVADLPPTGRGPPARRGRSGRSSRMALETRPPGWPTCWPAAPEPGAALPGMA